MKNFFQTKKILGLFLVLCLIMTTVTPVGTKAEAAGSNRTIGFEKVDNSVIAGSNKVGETAAFVPNYDFNDNDLVRVSIVLDSESVLDAGFATEDIASNEAALDFIAETIEEQKDMEEKIEAVIGEDALDVQWNLAVAANIISADVAYGDIEAIAEIEGVKEVVVETKYLPCSPVDADAPEMIISSNAMTGVANAWAEGYTGAGGRIAIIDTGLDIKHQSFNNDAFMYALAEDAEAAGTTTDAYLAEIDLLDAEEIATVLPFLNAYSRVNSNVAASDFVISEKLPFGFNYVDSTVKYVEHVRDSQGEHGSHVAGIAAANRYLATEDGFVDALDTVMVAGNAPDAQVMVMKVFGMGGGAYDSDYMAAIEDAILLGADSVNLSLGSAAAGFTTSATYQDILDKLTETDTVVVMSAGNSGAWADETYAGELFADGVSYNTAGSPGSYTNSLGVASVDNYGSVGLGFSVAGVTYAYNESTEYGNAPLTTLAGDIDYVMIDGVGVEEDWTGIDLTGKVAICSRGTTSFFEKANIAVANGAAATIIYNNQSGVIGLNLTGYEYSAPCVSILQSDGAAIKAASTAETTEGGVTYYTGTLTISEGMQAIISTAKAYTMSSFSSWGVPGSLTLKPEISAPGGSIYSVNGTNNAGGGIDQYELMSGTSMAAPQVTGMMAVLKRYIETAPDKYFPAGISKRAIAQSLLMSTADPMVSEDNFIYPVIQQGAGLANVSNAMNAATIVMMDENATASAADGKVKAELGDDPEKTGVYSFGFTLTNITDEDHTYDLSEYVFTQALAGDEEVMFLTKATALMDTDTVYYVNGENVTDIPVEVNPYLAALEAAKAELEAAEAALAAANATAADASAKVEAAKEAVNDAAVKTAEAALAIAQAKAELVIAQANEQAAKALKKIDKKNGAKIYEEAKQKLQAAEKAVKAAEKQLKDAENAAKTVKNAVQAAEKAVDNALKVVTKAAAAQLKAQAKYDLVSALAENWAPSRVPNTVTVAKNSTVKVDVTIALTAEMKEIIDMLYPVGAYIEAYVCLDSTDDTASHSIPVLAFYGNWTDASMFDKGSYVEYAYGFEDLPPYLYDVNGLIGNTYTVYTADDGKEYNFGANLYAEEDAAMYSPEHNALNNENGDAIASVSYALIRNAAKRAIIISDAETGEMYFGGELPSQYGAYYSASSGKWMNTKSQLSLNWKGTDANGKALPEGTKVVISTVAVPEYNLDAEGEIDFASLGKGAFFSTQLTIDNTAPEAVLVTGTQKGETDEDATLESLTISASDNQFVAAVQVFTVDGQNVASVAVGAQQTELTIDELEANVYYVAVVDYAGNMSLYKVFINCEPTEYAESVAISDSYITLVKNNSQKLYAAVNPVTVMDESVTWMSADESVAVVDENGVVTGVGLGSTTVYAIANTPKDADGNPAYATCDVDVIEFNVDLNGVVWDEEGQVWFSQFNTNSIPEYTKLAGADAAINATADLNSVMFASDIDTQNEVSTLYTLDRNTFELNEIGTSEICYTSMTAAPHLTGLIGTYANYVVLIDPNTGDYAGAFNYASSDLVGMTYIGSQYHPSYRTYLDMYYLLDVAGNIYFEAFINFNGSYYFFNGADEAIIGNTGITTDSWYFQSMYFNGEYTFISNFVEANNEVVLYAVDTEYTGAVYKLGTFADGVWPVAALSNSYPAGELTNSRANAFADAEVKAEASTERIEKIGMMTISK